MLTKRCTKCERTKPLHSFSKKSKSPDGFNWQCRDCISAKRRKDRQENPEILEKERKRKGVKTPRQSVHICLTEEERKERRRKQKRAAYARRREEHASKYRERMDSDPIFNMKVTIRTAIRKAIKEYTSEDKTKKRAGSSVAIGCEWGDFIKHIESKFTDGMTWENRSEWHIDHIIPLATAKNTSDVLRLNHYTNLRPLWRFENLSKGAKIF